MISSERRQSGRALTLTRNQSQRLNCGENDN